MSSRVAASGFRRTSSGAVTARRHHRARPRQRRSRRAYLALARRLSKVADAMASRLVAALSRVPYLAAITSPCSVMRMRPFTVPGGCARIAAKLEPPPRPTAPPPPVEKLHRRARPREHRRQRAARLMEAPHRGEIAAVLVRIRIADHHFLMPARRRDRRRFGQGEPFGHHVGRVFEIADRLEQRHDHDRRRRRIARAGTARLP